jgi:hypothetical protein
MAEDNRLKYIYSRIRENGKNTYWWKGIYVMEEDWDNLILLDACRYDTFKEVTGTDTDFRISRGSSTSEFLKENFAGRKFNDTVIVAANPHVDRIVKNSFYKVISVWKQGWNDRLNTVLPQIMLEYAIKAEKEYPNKRLIVWFMQPHYPYIENPELCSYGYKRAREIAETNKAKSPLVTPWSEADKGKLEIEEVWNAYKRNLEIVISYVFELAEKLRGKTVITSDHGNAFRRLCFPIPIRIVGHPSKIHIPELVKVPWLVLESKERKEIRKESEEKIIKNKVKKLKGSGKL